MSCAKGRGIGQDEMRTKGRGHVRHVDGAHLRRSKCNNISDKRIISVNLRSSNLEGMVQPFCRRRSSEMRVRQTGLGQIESSGPKTDTRVYISDSMGFPGAKNNRGKRCHSIPAPGSGKYLWNVDVYTRVPSMSFRLGTQGTCGALDGEIRTTTHCRVARTIVDTSGDQSRPPAKAFPASTRRPLALANRPPASDAKHPPPISTRPQPPVRQFLDRGLPPHPEAPPPCFSPTPPRAASTPPPSPSPCCPR